MISLHRAYDMECRLKSTSHPCGIRGFQRDARHEFENPVKQEVGKNNRDLDLIELKNRSSRRAFYILSPKQSTAEVLRTATSPHLNDGF